MTLLVDAPTQQRPDMVSHPSPSAPLVVAEHLVAALTVLWWAGPMTTRLGGRGPAATAVAIVLVALLFAVTRAWRRVSLSLLVAAALVAVGGLVMCLAAPTGWYGADDFAGYVLFALAVPSFAAYASTPKRRVLLVCAIPLAGLAQFAQAFWPWWERGDPTGAMIGTFYWWNPYAAFLLPGAILGAALAIRHERPWRLIGWICTPVCAAGIVFSSSRTTLALLAAGMLGLLLICVGTDWPRNVLRWVTAVGLCVAAVFALSGPPFFDHRGGVGAAAEAKPREARPSHRTVPTGWSSGSAPSPSSKTGRSSAQVPTRS